MRISPEIADSLELRFSAAARGMNARGERIISLGLGEPDFPTPTAVVEAAAQAMRDGFTRYSNPLGLVELRELLAMKLRRENGIVATAEDILVTPGAKMALSLALAAILEPGDEIIVIMPCYPSYIPQVKIAEPEAVIHEVSLKRADFSLDLDDVASRINRRTKAILLNFPHSPTGYMLSSPETERLVALLRAHECTVICDEIYERLDFAGIPNVSLGARSELAARTITINGFSKAFSMTGWRIGYAVTSDRLLMKTMSRLHQHMNTHTATFVQKAACAALSLPADFLDGYKARLKQNACLLAEMAAANPALSLTEPRGGLFAFLDISRCKLGSDAFACGLLESANVAVTPGVLFGKGWDSHVRISLAADAGVFGEGLKRLDAFARQAACR